MILRQVLTSIALLLALVAAMLFSAPASAQTTGVVVQPNANSFYGITSVVTASAGSQSLVLKALPGNLYSVSADNTAQTLSGKLIITNLAAAPASGALASGVVLDCVSIMTGGTLGSSVTINYAPGPMAVYSAGITALLSTSSNCGTWTPGAISGFIRGVVQ